MSDKKNGDGLIIGILLVLVLMLVVGGGCGAAYWFVAEKRSQDQVEDQRQRTIQALKEVGEAQQSASQGETSERDNQATEALPNEEAPHPDEQKQTESP